MIRKANNFYKQFHTCLSPLNIHKLCQHLYINRHASHMIPECFVFFGRSDQVKKCAQMNSEKKDTVFHVATSQHGARVL